MTKEFKNEGKGEADEENQREKLEEDDICDITLIWPAEDIAKEKEIAVRHSRERERTTPDNSVEMVAYINNFFTWLSAISRLLLFLAASLMLIMFVIIMYAIDLEAKEQGKSINKFLSDVGSISGLTKDQDTIIGRIFFCLVNAGAILMLFSNFGFFILPAWEDSVGLLTRDCGRVGTIVQEGCKAVAYRSGYARAETKYNWVLSEEGIFKMMYSVIAPTGLIIFASAPSPPNDNNSPAKQLQFMLHLVGIFSACGPLMICELYQIIRGERIFKRCTGLRQVFRLVCVVAAVISFLVYKILDSKYGHGTPGKGKSCKAEFACMIFLLADLIAISFTPVKAEQSVIALGGSSWRKDKNRRDAIKGQ